MTSISIPRFLASPALAGALAIIAAFLGLVGVMKPRPKLRLHARLYDPAFRNVAVPVTTDGIQSNPMCIEITNTGRRKITVREVGFVMEPPLDTPVGVVSFMQIADAALPVALEPGQTHTAFGPAAKLPISRFRRARAVDTEGKEWNSPRGPF